MTHALCTPFPQSQSEPSNSAQTDSVQPLNVAVATSQGRHTQILPPVLTAEQRAHDKLTARGIADVARTYGWRFDVYYGRPGWTFPVEYPTGCVKRWKTLDVSKPKYIWWTNKPDTCKYYVPQGVEALRSAIAACEGRLYIANGEPSLLTYLAAGVANVLCWFGEGSVPPTLATNLQALGVTTVLYPVDKDQAGDQSAIAVNSRLLDSPILFQPLDWGDSVPDKGDANDQWITDGFDAARFVHSLNHLAAHRLQMGLVSCFEQSRLSLDAGHSTRPEAIEAGLRRAVIREAPVTGVKQRGDFTSPKDSRKSTDAGHMTRLEAIEAVIGMAFDVSENGDFTNFCCLLHDEHHPSAGINRRTGTYKCFVCGSFRLEEIAELLGINYRRPVEKAPRKSHERVPTPSPGTPTEPMVGHVSDVLNPDVIAAERTLLIHAPTGLGKSHAVGTYVNQLPPEDVITAMAQFRLLTLALAQLLRDFDHYEQADPAYQSALSSVNRLVTSLSSLSKFDRQHGRAVIDEITGVLNFLVGSRTYKGAGALKTYQALKALVRGVDQLIGMDANLDDITLGWIERQRGPATVKRFRRSQSRGQVDLLRGQTEAVYQIGKLLARRRGLVTVACSAEVTTTQVAEHYKAQGYRVLKCTRDTSNTPEVKLASTSAEARKAYDLIVYDSCWGAGVDLSEPIYAHIGIFNRMPLAPQEAIQLYGRVRQASRRYAAVPPVSEGYHTPTAERLLADVLKREHWSAQRAGRPVQDQGDMLELAELWAQFEAKRQREMAQWRPFFLERLQADGFSLVENNARAPEAFGEAWRACVKAQDEANWQAVLACLNPLDDERLEALRLSGTEIDSTLRLCNVRWKIERAKASATVTEQDRDLMPHRGRQRLFQLTDFFSDETALLKADQGDERPIHQRRYSVLRQQVVAKLLGRVDLHGAPIEQFLAFKRFFDTRPSIAEVGKRFAAFATPAALALFEELGHHGNNARTVHGLCRWLFDYFGLELLSRQERRKGEKLMVYWVDEAAFRYRIERARAAAERRQDQPPKNVHSSLSYTFLDNPAPAATPAPAAPSNWEVDEWGDPAELAALDFGEAKPTSEKALP